MMTAPTRVHLPRRTFSPKMSERYQLRSSTRRPSICTPCAARHSSSPAFSPAMYTSDFLAGQSRKMGISARGITKTRHIMKMMIAELVASMGETKSIWMLPMM